MPVTLIYEGVTPSNKPKKYGLQLTALGYRYNIPTWGTVVVTKPFIDRISLTVPVENPLLQAVIKSALMDVDKGDLKSFETINPANKQYSVSAQYVDPVNGATVLFQVAPKSKKTKHFLRLEFNPQQLRVAGIKRLKDALAYLSIEELT
ncbi:MAG: hypothetical protein E2O36_00675, partial [Proteobacteria bacterium]